MRRTVFPPVLLDCGCAVDPTDAGGVRGRRISCPGHGLIHALNLAEEVTTFRYVGVRLDPPDPRPEGDEIVETA